MKAISHLWILSLSMLAVARPTISDRALRIPLERRSRNARSPHSARSEQLFGAHRVKRFLRYTHRKYEATFTAYERNTGSRHPLDALSRPSSTSQSNPARRGVERLEDDDSLLWYGLFEIGTPPQTFIADFDTGSADLWVPTERCKITCDGHKVYNASQSSTCRGTPKPTVLQYGSGAVVTCDIYTDTVQVAGCTLLDQQFGGIVAESPSFWNNGAPISGEFPADALFGLGFEEISALKAPPPVENMKNSSQMLDGRLSFRLSDEPGCSELIVGGANYSAFKNNTRVSAPVTTEGYWQITLGGISRSGHQMVPESIERPAIVDTGTTLIVVPIALANSYFLGVDGAKCINGICTVPCNIINLTTPILTIQGRGFPISPSTWNFGPDQPGSEDCMTGMGTSDELPLIVGDVALRNLYTMFNLREPCVDFAELVESVC